MRERSTACRSRASASAAKVLNLAEALRRRAVSLVAFSPSSNCGKRRLGISASRRSAVTKIDSSPSPDLIWVNPRADFSLIINLSDIF